LKEFSILMCGSARVGKSTLINAICGRELAKTSAHLDSCTKDIEKYSLEHSYIDEFSQKQITSIVSFWDTPGLENWTEKDAKAYIMELLTKTYPICMIFCASPGSLVNSEVVAWLCEACHGCGIFFALVCTNQFSGTDEQVSAVLKDFRGILERVAGARAKEEGEIYHCYLVGLVAAVNSVVYENTRLGVRVTAKGVNELCLEIMKELDKERLKGWCITLLQNRSFWEKFSHKVKDMWVTFTYKIENWMLKALVQ